MSHTAGPEKIKETIGEFNEELEETDDPIMREEIEDKIRLGKLSKEAKEKDIENVAFLRTRIDLICRCFEENEVDEIWITFPDPQIKFKRTKHRLTNPQFLAKYKSILKPKGYVHLKTDSEYMHGYTLGLLEGMGIEVDYSHHDLYSNPHAPEEATAIFFALAKTFSKASLLEIPLAKGMVQ